ncbi:hypothetical protein Dimus_027013, partial [Dionaea muscipula]
MTVIHLKKKDVVKSSVKGIDIEFYHERLATILGVPERNGICEYIKEVWEESKYTKPLDITRRIANNETLTTCQVQEEIPAAAPQSSAQQKDQTTSGVDPSRPTSENS